VANAGGNETLIVHANEDNPWVTLPCVVSVKEAAVKLFVHSSNGVGFLLSKNVFFKSQIPQLICTATRSVDE